MEEESTVFGGCFGDHRNVAGRRNCHRFPVTFLATRKNGVENPVSFSAVISGCMQNGYAEAALKFFQKMQVSKIKPDVATMIGLLPACSYLAALQHGACGHSYSIVRGFTADISICNALTDMYCKCGKVDVARLVFDRMHTRDIVSWNAMIIGYGVHGLGTKAISMFYEMLAEGWKPDDVTSN